MSDSEEVRDDDAVVGQDTLINSSGNEHFLFNDDSNFNPQRLVVTSSEEQKTQGHSFGGDNLTKLSAGNPELDYGDHSYKSSHPRSDSLVKTTAKVYTGLEKIKRGIKSKFRGNNQNDDKKGVLGYRNPSYDRIK